MPHKSWCGKECAKCNSPCPKDKNSNCNLDCLFLGRSGEMAFDVCLSCKEEWYRKNPETL